MALEYLFTMVVCVFLTIVLAMWLKRFFARHCALCTKIGGVIDHYVEGHPTLYARDEGFYCFFQNSVFRGK